MDLCHLRLRPEWQRKILHQREPLGGSARIAAGGREQHESVLLDGILEGCQLVAAQPERRPYTPLHWLYSAEATAEQTAPKASTQHENQRLRDHQAPKGGPHGAQTT